jgi:hypothetical protein
VADELKALLTTVAVAFALGWVAAEVYARAIASLH